MGLPASYDRSSLKVGCEDGDLAGGEPSRLKWKGKRMGRKRRL